MEASRWTDTSNQYYVITTLPLLVALVFKDVLRTTCVFAYLMESNCNDCIVQKMASSTTQQSSWE